MILEMSQLKKNSVLMVKLVMFTFPAVLEAANQEDLHLLDFLTRKMQRMHSEHWTVQSWMDVRLKFRRPEKEELKIPVKL